jgi:hypothetical protein
MKSKPNTRKAVARARNWKIYSNHSKERAKAREGKCAGSGPRPSRYKTQFPFQSCRAGTSPSFPEPASRNTVPSALKPEDLARSVREASGHRNPYLRIRTVTVLSKEES